MAHRSGSFSRNVSQPSGSCDFCLSQIYIQPLNGSVGDFLVYSPLGVCKQFPFRTSRSMEHVAMRRHNESSAAEHTYRLSLVLFHDL